jgi:hypothetical protein
VGGKENDQESKQLILCSSTDVFILLVYKSACQDLQVFDPVCPSIQVFSISFRSQLGQPVVTFKPQS